MGKVSNQTAQQEGQDEVKFVIEVQVLREHKCNRKWSVIV